METVSLKETNLICDSATLAARQAAIAWNYALRVKVLPMPI